MSGSKQHAALTDFDDTTVVLVAEGRGAPRLHLSNPKQLNLVARGTRRYRRICVALFLGGFSTFGLLNCVQPLLPELAREFGVSPGESAMALGLATAGLAIAVLVAGASSQALGRRGLMFWSMAMGALLNVLVSFAPSWSLLLMLRTLEGVALGGVPAVAMAYLAEEIDPLHLGAAMGLYVAGTACGGMLGRISMGLLAEAGSWRSAMATLGVLDLVISVAFVVILPRSRNFVRFSSIDPRRHLKIWFGLLRKHSLLRLFGIAFCLMGTFVALFNYAAFRLESAPYDLNQRQISLLFLVYGFGIASSSIAGRLTEQWGRRAMLLAGATTMLAGAGLTAGAPLLLFGAGIAVFTLGFFCAHTVASGWVGPLAGTAKGHAAALYLLAHYMGASALGTLGGWFWQKGAWTGVMLFMVTLISIGLVLGIFQAKCAEERGPGSVT